MAKLCLLMVALLVAGVSSQSYPHFEFRGDVLVNNSYVFRGGQSDPERIGEGHNDSLHCVTDNSDCCTNGQGNWYDETGGLFQNNTTKNAGNYELAFVVFLKSSCMCRKI